MRIRTASVAYEGVRLRPASLARIPEDGGRHGRAGAWGSSSCTRCRIAAGAIGRDRRAAPRLRRAPLGSARHDGDRLRTSADGSTGFTRCSSKPAS